MHISGWIFRSRDLRLGPKRHPQAPGLQLQAFIFGAGTQPPARRTPLKQLEYADGQADGQASLEV
jgi:hypothetical protein